jgi:hypothetical protein
VACAVCAKCTDLGSTADCSTLYAVGAQDTTSPGLCSGTNACDGAGSGAGDCLLANGQTCASSGACASGCCDNNSSPPCSGSGTCR